MDPFSHLMLAYLLNFGAWGPGGIQYVVAGAFAGALPDLDVVFIPISKYLPLLRHRGISHSLLGVTGIAVVGTWLIPLALAWVFGAAFAVGSPLAYFVALELGGLSHILLDAMDHWSVPIFAPFSPKEFHFDADRIVNVGAMSFTVGSYAILLYERGRVPLLWWEVTTWLLLVAAMAYIVVRLGTRWRIERVRRTDGFSDVVPQANPLRFRLVEEHDGPDRYRVRTATYDLLRGYVEPPRTVEAPAVAPGAGPVASAQAAVERSYATALAKSWVLGETHHFAEVRARPGCFEVFWHSLEMTFGGRAAGVVARVDTTTGAVEAETAWRRPAAFRDSPG